MATRQVLSGPEVGEILVLPELVILPEAQAATRWHRESDGSLVLFVAHSAHCPECVVYAESLAAQSNEFGWWGGRSTVVLPAADSSARGLASRLPLRFVADPKCAARDRWRLDDGDGALVVADRWGQVYLSVNVGQGHALPTIGTVTRVLTQIGIQCPECGVPDVPWPGVTL